MWHTLSSAIQAWATGLGGFGLFVLAALDSSFLSFPQINDFLIIVLSTKYPARMPYYASMTTLGSLLGCFALYAVTRRGGETFLRKRFSGARVDRGLALYQRHGLLAVIVPALLPPPVPLKLFVLLAGAGRVSPWKFGAAILIARSIRYFGQGYLAVRYGARAATLVAENGRIVAFSLAVIALVISAIYYLARRRRAPPAVIDQSGGNSSTRGGN